MNYILSITPLVLLFIIQQPSVSDTPDHSVSGYSNPGKWSDTSNGLICRLFSQKKVYGKDDTIVIYLEIKNVSRDTIPTGGLISEYELLSIRPYEKPYYTNHSFPWVYDTLRYRERINKEAEPLLPESSIISYCKISQYFFQWDTAYTFDLKIDRVTDYDSLYQYLNNAPVYFKSKYPSWKGILDPDGISIVVKGHSIRKKAVKDLLELIASEKMTYYDREVVSSVLEEKGDAIIPIIRQKYPGYNRITRLAIVNILNKMNTVSALKLLVENYYLADSIKEHIAYTLTHHHCKEAENVYVEMIKNNMHTTSAIIALGSTKSPDAAQFLDSIKNITNDKSIYICAHRALSSINGSGPSKSASTAILDVLRIKCIQNDNVSRDDIVFFDRLNSAETDFDSLCKIVRANENELLFDMIIRLLDLSSPSKVPLECKKAQYDFLMPIVLANKTILEKKYLNELIRVFQGEGYRWRNERGMLLHIIKSAELTEEYSKFIENLSEKDLEYYDYIVNWFVKN